MNTEWNAIKMNIKCANDTKKPLFLHLLHKKKSKKTRRLFVMCLNGMEIKLNEEKRVKMTMNAHRVNSNDL